MLLRWCNNNNNIILIVSLQNTTGQMTQLDHSVPLKGLYHVDYVYDYVNGIPREAVVNDHSKTHQGQCTPSAFLTVVYLACLSCSTTLHS